MKKNTNTKMLAIASLFTLILSGSAEDLKATVVIPSITETKTDVRVPTPVLVETPKEPKSANTLLGMKKLPTDGLVRAKPTTIQTTTKTRKLNVTPQGLQTHVVKRGETLNGIAFHYRVASLKLQLWNRLSNPNKLLVGQHLQIPPPLLTLHAPKIIAVPQSKVSTANTNFVKPTI